MVELTQFEKNLIYEQAYDEVLDDVMNSKEIIDMINARISVLTDEIMIRKLTFQIKSLP
jgi:hypothetical protein